MFFALKPIRKKVTILDGNKFCLQNEVCGAVVQKMLRAIFVAEH